MQSTMTNFGSTRSCQDGLQHSRGDCVKNGYWEDQTCRIEILVAAGGGQLGKSDHEAGPRKSSFGGPLDGGKIVARDR